MNFDGKLGICFPLVDDRLFRSFFISWLTLIKPSNYEVIIPDIAPANFPESHAAVRNNMVKKALECDCTDIWMADTDQIYPKDTLVKLFSHNLPVVCGKVHRRYPPFDPILYQKTKWKYKFFDTPRDKWKNGELIEVEATGAACMLIRSEVFEKVEQPWFRVLRPNKRRDYPVGEDIYFWVNVRKAGYRIFVDTSIEVGHIASLTINKNFYDLYRLAVGREEPFLTAEPKKKKGTTNNK